MTDLEKLKKTFDEIGVHYIEEIGEFQVEFGVECQYINIYCSSEEESKENKLEERFFGSDRHFFEFRNGSIASY